MVNDRIHFAVSLSDEKLPDGPITSPRPGPMLATAVAAPETEVTKSSPVMDRSTVTMPSVRMKATKNTITEDSTSSPTGRPS